uniref:hypothetical protein n=1 Tax=Calothrix parietina TaxID=32054 RepID=UPI001A7EE435
MELKKLCVPLPSRKVEFCAASQINSMRASEFSQRNNTNLNSFCGTSIYSRGHGNAHTCQLNVKPPFHLAPMLCVGAEIYEALPQFIRR